MKSTETLEEMLARCSAWDGQCLLWQGARIRGGYANTGYGKRRSVLVSRLILADQLGVDIDDLGPKVHALHSCDRGHDGCVTPEHIHPGTQADNMREAVERRRHSQSRKDTCTRGHLLVEGNLRTHMLPVRRCLVCSRARSAAHWKNKHASPTTIEAEVERILKEDPELAAVALP